MADQVLTRDGPVSVPMEYPVPQAGELLPLTVIATMDGTSAASAFYPAVQVVAPSGRVMGTAVSSSVAAGASATVTWFPGVTQYVSAAKVAVVGARIEMHGSQTVSNSTDTDLIYDTVVFDTAGMANLAANNKKLTVTVGGLYLVVCERAWPVNTVNERLVGILLNGFIASGGSYNVDNAQNGIVGGGQTTNLAVALIQAVAGDFFATGCNQNSGGNLSTGGGPAEFFSAHLVGTV